MSAKIPVLPGLGDKDYKRHFTTGQTAEVRFLSGAWEHGLNFGWKTLRSIELNGQVEVGRSDTRDFLE